MNCNEARRLIGAEPERIDGVLEAHLSGCEECQRFRREMQTLNTDIQRALSLPLSSWRQPTQFERSQPATRRWAMAAGIALAFVAGAVFWVVQPRQALARDVVVHMVHEPQSWKDHTAVTRSELEYALRSSGVRLDLAENAITYARTCWFRGHFVPHLVVRTMQGPVTVMLLRHESVSGAQRFSEDGYTGVLLPAQEGSIAVVGLGAAPVDEAAERILQAVRPGNPSN